MDMNEVDKCEWNISVWMKDIYIWLKEISVSEENKCEWRRWIWEDLKVWMKDMSIRRFMSVKGFI